MMQSRRLLCLLLCGLAAAAPAVARSRALRVSVGRLAVACTASREGGESREASRRAHLRYQPPRSPSLPPRAQVDGTEASGATLEAQTGGSAEWWVVDGDVATAAAGAAAKPASEAEPQEDGASSVLAALREQLAALEAKQAALEAVQATEQAQAAAEPQAQQPQAAAEEQQQQEQEAAAATQVRCGHARGAGSAAALHARMCRCVLRGGRRAAARCRAKSPLPSPALPRPLLPTAAAGRC